MEEDNPQTNCKVVNSQNTVDDNLSSCTTLSVDVQQLDDTKNGDTSTSPSGTVNTSFSPVNISPSSSCIMDKPQTTFLRRNSDFMRRLSLVDSFRNMQPMAMFSLRQSMSSSSFSPSPYKSPSPPPCCECCESYFGTKK